MKSFKLIGIERFGLFDIPQPATELATDVLIKMGRVGICGSDVHYYSEGKIGSQVVEYPWTVGHEGSGTVVSVGSSVTSVAPGDRVAFDPALPCWSCQQCYVGRPHTCLNLKFLGCPQQTEGCLSEYVVLPERSCLPLPNKMSLEEAAMVEPLSIAVYAASLCGTLAGVSVAILGCGPIGLSVLQVVKSEGAKTIYATDNIDDRLKAARRFGATWTGNPLKVKVVAEIESLMPSGVDFVFECSGQQEALDQAIEILRPGGELSLIGIPESNRISFNINLLRRKEITIQNVRRQNDCMYAALEFIRSGKVNAKSMITHRFRFSQTPEAFDLVKNYRDGVVKAIIGFD